MASSTVAASAAAGVGPRSAPAPSNRLQRPSAAAALAGGRRRARQQQQTRLRVRATAAEVEEAPLSEDEKIAKMLAKPYKYGFKTIIETEQFPKGLSEDVVRAISAKKEEPEWMLDFRCAAPPAPPRRLLTST